MSEQGFDLFWKTALVSFLHLMSMAFFESPFSEATVTSDEPRSLEGRALVFSREVTYCHQDTLNRGQVRMRPTSQGDGQPLLRSFPQGLHDSGHDFTSQTRRGPWQHLTHSQGLSLDPIIRDISRTEALKRHPQVYFRMLKSYSELLWWSRLRPRELSGFQGWEHGHHRGSDSPAPRRGWVTIHVSSHRRQGGPQYAQTHRSLISYDSRHEEVNWMEDQRGRQLQRTQGPPWQPAAQTLCTHGCTHPAPRTPRPFTAYRASLRHFFPTQKPESTSPLETPFSLRILPWAGESQRSVHLEGLQPLQTESFTGITEP